MCGEICQMRAFPTIHFAHNLTASVTVPPAPPAFRHLAHRLEDPDEFAVAVSGGALSADFLAAPERPTRIEQFQSSLWAIDFHQAHVRARIFGGLPGGWASLGLMCGPAVSNWYGDSTGGGTLVCTPPGEPIDGCTCPGFECVSVGISPEMWEAARRLAAPERPDFGVCRALPLTPERYHGLLQRIRAVRLQLRGAGRGPEVVQRAAMAAAAVVSELATTAWELAGSPAEERHGGRNRARLARRAEAWLRAHQDQPMSVPRLCEALRVSRRELEYAFRGNFDLPPHAYLEALRLNAVRRDLRRPAPSGGLTIAEIILAHGFTHLGRFATRYRALFGEKPSETKRR
jgi:AraC family ethanolamine operon transcriptional activator